MPLITLEEYAEKHTLDSNYLYLLVAGGRLPHQRHLGRVYAADQVLEQLKEEQRFQEKT